MESARYLLADEPWSSEELFQKRARFSITGNVEIEQSQELRLTSAQ
jgi:hypothetical protein